MSYKLLKKGKVRDVYDINRGVLLIRHSDRVSAFDQVWCEIKGKGEILCKTAVWWFERTKHIIPNHLVYACPNNIDIIVKKCDVFPVEFVVRGYITGTTNTSLWHHYKQGKRKYCGIQFPDGLKKNQKLASPVITPTTKGDIDEPISECDIVSRGLMTQQEYDYCARKSIELYDFGSKLAKGSGMILVDTKYEFGKDISNGKIILVDEMHTCDSSRYWKLDTYDARFRSGMEPEKFDKDLIRLYVNSQCDPYSTKASTVTIPEDIKVTVKNVYKDFFNTLTGIRLSSSNDDNINSNVHKNGGASFDYDLIRCIEEYFRNVHRNRVYIIADHIEYKPIVDDLQESFDKINVYTKTFQYTLSDADRLLYQLNRLSKLHQQHSHQHSHRVIYLVISHHKRIVALSQLIQKNVKNVVISFPQFGVQTEVLTRGGNLLDCLDGITMCDRDNICDVVNKMLNIG